MLRTIVGLGLLIVGFLIGSSQGSAEVDTKNEIMPKSFLSGKNWRSLSKGEQQAYAVGVIDGLDLAVAYERQGTNLAWINPCVTGMSSDQVRAMLQKEIDANPGEWNLFTVHQSMYRTLRKACRQKPVEER